MVREKSDMKVNSRKFIKGAAVAAPARAASSALGAWQPSLVLKQREWSRETDVVVLGTGFAGMSAAIAVKDAGIDDLGPTTATGR